MDRELYELVRSRAGDRCEYCHIPQSGVLLPLQIDHVVPRQHGGPDVEGNLALCCPQCNLNKGPNLASIEGGWPDIVPLFHPRADRWDEHFAWDGPVLRGLTVVGRVTVRLLDVNSTDRVDLRAELMAGGEMKG